MFKKWLKLRLETKPGASFKTWNLITLIFSDAYLMLTGRCRLLWDWCTWKIAPYQNFLFFIILNFSSVVFQNEAKVYDCPGSIFSYSGTKIVWPRRFKNVYMYLCMYKREEEWTQQSQDNNNNYCTSAYFNFAIINRRSNGFHYITCR